MIFIIIIIGEPACMASLLHLTTNATLTSKFLIMGTPDEEI